ncbi:MAG: hypothetical protein ACYST6_03075 [Planctomycetota bacterium]
MIWVYLVGGVLGVLILICFLSVAGTRRKLKQELRRMRISDIEPLFEECIVTLREKLGLELDLDDPEGSAEILDTHMSTSALRNAFSRKGFNLYFVMPVGAFVGELIRRHGDADWQQEEDGSMSVWVRYGDEEYTVQPFEMAMEQTFGAKGTIFANLISDTLQGEEVVGSEAADSNAHIDGAEPAVVSEIGDTEGTGDAEGAGEVEEAGDTEILDLQKRVVNGANWFYWIAGLSLVNSVLFLAGVQWGFIFGLGITQVIDAATIEIGGETNYVARMVGFGLDVIAASVFALFGFLSHKRHGGAFVTGMILYALDAMLFLVAGDFLGLAFHAVALYMIFCGFKANRTLKVKTVSRTLVPGTSLRPMVVSLESETSHEGSTKEVIWPVVITIVSLIYAIIYAIVNLRGLSNPWRLGVCLCLFTGVLGIALKRRAEPMSTGVIIVISVLTLVFAGWPIFLIVWFLRRPIRTFVREEWR